MLFIHFLKIHVCILVVWPQMSVTKWIIHFILNASPWVIFDSFPRLKESSKFADLATKKETDQKNWARIWSIYSSSPHPTPQKTTSKNTLNYSRIFRRSVQSLKENFWQYWFEVKVQVLVAQSCLTLCKPLDCSRSGSSVHGILQARILDWVAILFSRGSSWPRGWTWVSCIAHRSLTSWATRESPLIWRDAL